MDECAVADYEQYLFDTHAHTHAHDVVNANAAEAAEAEMNAVMGVEDYDAPDIVFCTTPDCAGADACGKAHLNLSAEEHTEVAMIKEYIRARLASACASASASAASEVTPPLDVSK